MSALLDAFWRAAAYCLHPRVIVLSLVPLRHRRRRCASGSATSTGKPRSPLCARRSRRGRWSRRCFGWLDTVGAGGLGTALAPLVMVALAVPVIVVLSLLLVALLMTPAIVRLVAARRFPALERRHGATMLAGRAVVARLRAVARCSRSSSACRCGSCRRWC